MDEILHFFQVYGGESVPKEIEATTLITPSQDIPLRDYLATKTILIGRAIQLPLERNTTTNRFFCLAPVNAVQNGSEHLTEETTGDDFVDFICSVVRCWLDTVLGNRHETSPNEIPDLRELLSELLEFGTRPERAKVEEVFLYWERSEFGVVYIAKSTPS
jgi:hypothetical protein